MPKLKTKIGLEIHVQLKTKSKMFCRCDNNAENKVPNTTVCPICMGMPGTLPVANKQAILWTIKTGLVLNCKIPKIAKFDRKHYFYPDLPKGYQISQYDEPFCVGGEVEIDGKKIRLNRIHLEEDAGKLIHSNGQSLADLNRAGTPLMEIVTEPDITSPEQAGEFLRKLQKIVRDVVAVSEASMEKGHLRCDANISVSDETGLMSPIVELKNINSFRFVEKALTLAEEKLKNEFLNWPEKLTKETWGYDSKKNQIFIQRKKEESADYRYFPEPDLPPFDTNEFDLEKLKSEIAEGEEMIIEKLNQLGVSGQYATVLISDKTKYNNFNKLLTQAGENYSSIVAKFIVQDYFPKENFDKNIKEYAQIIVEADLLPRNILKKIIELIVAGKTVEEAKKMVGNSLIDVSEIEKIIDNILSKNSVEVEKYKSGQKQVLGFFMGQVMKESGGKADPVETKKLLLEKLEK